jgi:hypothetical protein
VTINELVPARVTDDPRPDTVEEPDAGQIEALRWLQTQLTWERRLTNIRHGAAAELYGHTAP